MRSTENDYIMGAVHRQSDRAGRDEEVSAVDAYHDGGRSSGRRRFRVEINMLVTSGADHRPGLGSMYGLLALGFHVTYAVSSTVNFAQGSTMMLGAVLCYTFAVTFGWPLPLAAAARARAVRALRACRRARRGAAVRAARLECLADGDGRARHRRRQRGAVHLRQGPARHAVMPWATRFGRQSRASTFSCCRSLIPVVGLVLARGLHLFSTRRATARRCSRWCRTATPRA